MEWEKAGGAASSGGKKGKKRRWIVVVAVIALLFIIGRMASCGNDNAEAITWPSSGLATMLPEPENPKGDIITNSDESLSVSLEEVSEADRTEYIEACKDKGFTVEAENDTSSYEAFNEDGYKLRLTFFGDDDLDIELDAPMEMATIAWPTTGPASQVPTPPSLTGKVSTDREDMYAVYLGSMDLAAFTSYANQCRDAGFSTDYVMQDDLFSAKNAAGYGVRITYEGFSVVNMSVSAPDDASADAATDGTEDASTDAGATNGDAVATEATPTDSTSFRAMVDEYEAFMNEYVDFMVTYQNSDNIVAMAADYARMTARYAEMTEKIATIDDSTLSAEDAAYLLDAQNRVNTRLLEIS